MRLPAPEYEALLVSLLGEGRTVVTSLRGVSMAPAMPDGAVAQIVPLTHPLRPGEVALSRTPQGLLCHRVVRVTATALQTWGDVCRAPDAPVALDEVLGQVVAVKCGGQWRPVLRRSGWRLLARNLKYCFRRALGLLAAPPVEAVCILAPDQPED